MGTLKTLQSADGHSFEVYVAQPTGAIKGAVVIAPEIFGVNPYIRSVADRFAEQGYLTAAPALFDRIAPKYEATYEQPNVEKGIAIIQQIPFEQAIADLQTTVDHVKLMQTKVSVVGFCWGGTLAWLASAKIAGLCASVCYYPGGIASNADLKPLCPVMLHLGELDKSPTPEAAKAALANHPTLLTYFYPAEHGFNCDQRASYSADDAALSQVRTLHFLELCATRWLDQ
jgi:carboxymethylenebutenolidase